MPKGKGQPSNVEKSVAKRTTRSTSRSNVENEDKQTDETTPYEKLLNKVQENKRKREAEAKSKPKKQKTAKYNESGKKNSNQFQGPFRRG